MAEIATTRKNNRAERKAKEKVAAFQRKNDPLHFRLACFAAVPLVLTPDLLYQIWANFVPEAPWIAVARILLSSLCEEVGYELYEIDALARAELLDNLLGEIDKALLRELGNFIIEYIENQWFADEEEEQELIRNQEWAIDSYSNPVTVVREISEALRFHIIRKNEYETRILISLLKKISKPIRDSGFDRLVTYAEALENFLSGNLEDALDQLNSFLVSEETLVVSGVSLPVPDEIQSLYRRRQQESAQLAENLAFEDLEEVFEENNKNVDDLLEVDNKQTETGCRGTSLYAIGIGGVGAKCLEALTHLVAAGLFHNPDSRSTMVINTLFVDADETNGCIERARSSMTQYQKCYELFESDRISQPWMQAVLRPLGLWSPLGQATTDKKLSSLFRYDSLQQLSPDLGSLLDVLFTPEELEANLEVGFRGRSAIGSAVMSQIELDKRDGDVWQQLIDKIRLEICPKIFLFGSIFGGTGASGIPTIGRMLHQRLEAENLRDRVSIASAFMLPYFSFTPASGLAKDEVYARSDQFLLNTEAALRYYVTQGKPFDTVYVLGNHNTTEVEFSLGKTSQRNLPHFIEMYAALGASHFLQTESRSNKGTQVALASRQNRNRLSWSDLPAGPLAKSRLGSATRFAYVWLANIAPELNQAKSIGIKNFQSGAPWFNKFFKPSTSALGRMFSSGGEELPDFNDSKEQEALSTITEWCLDYLRWLNEIHQCGDEIIGLFNTTCLTRAQGTQVIPDQLSELVLGVEADRSKRTNDSIPQLKMKLDDQDLAAAHGRGMVGLARTLYSLCAM